MSTSAKGEYVKARLVRIGSFEDITKATEEGPVYDGNFSMDQLVVPDQYDPNLS